MIIYELVELITLKKQRNHMKNPFKMDKHKIENTCRICLKIHDTLFSLYRKRKGSSPYEKLLNTIKLNIEIIDEGPSSICSQCLIELDTTVSFLEKCERSNELLASWLALGLVTDKSSKHDLNLDDESTEAKNLEDSFRSSSHPREDNDSGILETDGLVVAVERCPECRSGRRCAHWAPPLTYTCQYCNKVFNRKFNFKLHIKRHVGAREWPCPACGARQLTGWLAARHCRPAARRACPEPGCARTFTTNTNLNTHIRAHTGERPYECADCGKTFISKNTLNDHIRIHTGVKPYMCVVCGARFRTNKLARHMRSHGPAPRPRPPPAPLAPHAPAPAPARAHACPRCPARYSHKQSLNKHTRRHHAASNDTTATAATAAAESKS